MNEKFSEMDSRSSIFWYIGLVYLEVIRVDVETVEKIPRLKGFQSPPTSILMRCPVLRNYLELHEKASYVTILRRVLPA